MAKKRKRSNRPKPPASPDERAIEKSKERNKRKRAEQRGDQPDTSSSDAPVEIDKPGSDASPSYTAIEKSKERNQRKRAQELEDEKRERRAQERAAVKARQTPKPQISKPLPDLRTKPPVAHAATEGAIPEPRFWFGFEVTWSKLVFARVVIFSLLALDALLLVRHAPRYGANDFNVGQLAIFDGIGPGRIAYGAGLLILAYVFVLVALGVATRFLVPFSAVLYGWLYFGSQLDSYQHHYLVALVLAIASFESWERPEGARADTRVQSWPLRLILVQLAIMYLWAAISKMHPAWVDGTTLKLQMTGGVRTAIDSTIGFAVASVLVIIAELTLAATVWWRRGWIVAAPLGLLFHGGILTTNLEIGLFAGLMLGIYILVVPDAIWVWLAETPLAVSIRESARAFAERTSWVIFVVSVALGIAAAVLVQLESALVVAIVVASVPIGHAVRAVTRGTAPLAMAGVAHLTAIALWLVVDLTSTVAVDYYKYWGGSQRRLGDFEQAEHAYRSMIEVAPDDPIGHFHLGRILVTRPGTRARERVDEGLAELRRAQRLEPTRARSFVEEARVLASQGHTADALAKAKEGVFAEPSHPEARALVNSLEKSQAMPERAEDTD